MEYRVTKDLIDEMMYEAVLPFFSSEYCKRNRQELIKAGQDPNICRKALTRFATALMMPSTKRAEYFIQKALEILSDFDVDKEKFKIKIAKLFYLHRNYLQTKEFYDKKRYDKIVSMIIERIRENMGIEVEDSRVFGEDDFIDFDFSNNRNSHIDTMHYKEHEKIDAKSFFNKNSIDEELMIELQDELYELKEIVNYNIFLSEEYIETYKNTLIKFIKIFNFFSEFKDLNIAFERLYDFLNNYSFKDDKEENSILLKELLDSIYKDLQKWMEEVIINQTAQDIHYLDAALLANIEQIVLMFQEKKDNDDEFEFF